MNIVYSGLRTPDGTIISSCHTHDYVTHVDKNGKTYMIDGGHDYIRSSANGDEIFITIYDSDPHELQREYITWGSYGKTGNEALRYIKVKDMEDDHIQAVLDNVQNIKPSIKKCMQQEQKFREKS